VGKKNLSKKKLTEKRYTQNQKKKALIPIAVARTDSGKQRMRSETLRSANSKQSASHPQREESDQKQNSKTK
jgi:hypothetical protein